MYAHQAKLAVNCMLNYNVVFLFLHVLITKYVVCVSVNSALMSDLYPLA